MGAMIHTHVNMGMLREIVEEFIGLSKFFSINGDQLTEARIGGTRKHVLISLTKIGKEIYSTRLINAIDR